MKSRVAYLLILSLLVSIPNYAQLGGVLGRAAKKAAEKRLEKEAEKKAEEVVNNAFDKALENSENENKSDPKKDTKPSSIFDRIGSTTKTEGHYDFNSSIVFTIVSKQNRKTETMTQEMYLSELNNIIGIKYLSSPGEDMAKNIEMIDFMVIDLDNSSIISFMDMKESGKKYMSVKFKNPKITDQDNPNNKITSLNEFKDIANHKCEAFKVEQSNNTYKIWLSTDPISDLKNLNSRFVSINEIINRSNRRNNSTFYINEELKRRMANGYVMFGYESENGEVTMAFKEIKPANKFSFDSSIYSSMF